MNFIHIVGRMAKDPETRFTASGQKVTVLVVATNSFKGGNEETIWWRVTLWGERWDKMMQHFTKGKPIMVGGEMRKPETYTDKAGVTQVGSIEITADYVKFVPFGRSDQAEDGQQGGAATQPKKQYGKPSGEEFYGGDSGFGGGQGAGSSFSNQGFGQQNPADDDNLPF